MKRAREVLALYCVGTLALSGCGPRRVTTAQTPRPVVRSAKEAKDAYRSIKPKDLSQYMRTVYRVSGENARLLPDAPAAAENPQIVRLSKVTAENPGDLEAVRALADLYLEENRLLEALELYARLEEERPQDRSLQRALASLWDRWGDYPQSLRHAARALDSAAMSADDWLFLGRIHVNGGNLAAAAEALRASAAAGPADNPAVAELGDVCFRLGNWSEAALFLRRALQQDPGQSGWRKKLAVALVRLQRDGQAWEEFQRLGPSAYAYNELGKAQALDRRWEEARHSFDAALRADSSFAEAKANLLRAETHLPLPQFVTLPSFEDLPPAKWRVELERFAQPQPAPDLPPPIRAGSKLAWANGAASLPPPDPRAQRRRDADAEPRLFQAGAAPALSSTLSSRAAGRPESPEAVQPLKAMARIERVVRLSPLPPDPPMAVQQSWERQPASYHLPAVSLAQAKAVQEVHLENLQPAFEDVAELGPLPEADGLFRVEEGQVVLEFATATLVPSSLQEPFETAASQRAYLQSSFPEDRMAVASLLADRLGQEEGFLLPSQGWAAAGSLRSPTPYEPSCCFWKEAVTAWIRSSVDIQRLAAASPKVAGSAAPFSTDLFGWSEAAEDGRLAMRSSAEDALLGMLLPASAPVSPTPAELFVFIEGDDFFAAPSPNPAHPIRQLDEPRAAGDPVKANLVVVSDPLRFERGSSAIALAPVVAEIRDVPGSNRPKRFLPWKPERWQDRFPARFPEVPRRFEAGAALPPYADLGRPGFSGHSLAFFAVSALALLAAALFRSGSRGRRQIPAQSTAA